MRLPSNPQQWLLAVSKSPPFFFAAPKAATPFCRAACPAAYPVSRRRAMPLPTVESAVSFLQAVGGGAVAWLLIRRHVASLAACRRAVNGVYSAKVDMYGTE